MVILQKASPPPRFRLGPRLRESYPGRRPPVGPLVLQVMVILQRPLPPLWASAGGFRLGPRLRESYPGQQAAPPLPQVGGGGYHWGGGGRSLTDVPWSKIFMWAMGQRVPLVSILDIAVSIPDCRKSSMTFPSVEHETNGLGFCPAKPSPYPVNNFEATPPCLGGRNPPKGTLFPPVPV